MVAIKNTESISQIISKRLRNSDILKVAIIDDAYDTPTVGSFYGGEIGDFWSEIERKADILEELNQLCPGIQKVEDIDDKCLSKLWENKDSLKRLAQPVNNVLFSDKIQQLKIVDEIKKYLEELNLEVGVFDSSGLPENQKYNIVLLDYYMGIQESKKAIINASILAKRIYRNCPCLIVLMSTYENVETKKEDFRKSSDLLQGLFAFVPKKALSDKVQLYLKLDTWARGISAGHSIQKFVSELENAFESAKKEFIDNAKSLSLDDYAFVSQLSLQPEAQPLGDYMLWLYGAFLSHQLQTSKEVKSQSSILDKLEFENFLPLGQQPSLILAQMYKIAASETNPGKVEIYSISSEENDSIKKIPRLHTGDIFIKDVNSDVLMVINAECDLAFSVNERRPKPERSIHLIPGRLQTFEEPLIENKKFIRTELFEYDDKTYRIIWDHNRVISKRHDEILKWLKKEKYSLKLLARLRSGFVLQVKQNFTANLNRAGLKVMPPICGVFDVEVFLKNGEGKSCSMGDPIKKSAFVFSKTASNEVRQALIFSEDFVHKLRSQITTELAHLKDDFEFWNQLKQQNVSLKPDWKNKQIMGGKVKLFNQSTNVQLDSQALLALNILITS